jgi:hypothetical protein
MVTENFENVKRALEAGDGVKVDAVIPLVMKDAYDDSDRTSKHLQKVQDELYKRAGCVITDNPGTGKEVKNVYTKQMKLDEEIEDFDISKVNRK